MLPTGPITPLRSVLYMPGSNARALEKARTLDADAVILDLEDSVAPDQKDLARDQVADAVRTGGFGHRVVVVRMNALTTPWGGADLEAAVAAGATTLLVPKVDGPDGVRQVETMLRDRGGDATAIWVMLETPLAILNAAAIAGATPALTTLVMGTSDLAKDLGAAHTRDREPMITALGLCLLGARAHGKAILDGVCLDLNDLDAFAAECRQGRDLGFDGKTLIHPKTIAGANAAFSPDAAAVERARAIVAAHAEAQAAGRGVTVVDGRLVEHLHVQTAQRTLALAAAISARAVPAEG